MPRLTPVQKIERIDAKIDAVRVELRRRRRVNQMSSTSWQRAWDLEPELKRESDRLFRLRFVQQELRDEAAYAEQKRVERANRAVAAQLRRQQQASKCPTCGGFMPIAA